jgi:hypothetical protein
VRADRPLPDDIDDRVAILASRWREDPKVAAVYLFGSRAHGGAASLSDVDLAVVLTTGLGADARWSTRMALLSDAYRQLGTEAVDLVVLEDAPSVLGHRILRDGRLLAESDPRRRVAVAEGVLRRYFDEAHLRAELDRGLAARVQDGSFAG